MLRLISWVIDWPEKHKPLLEDLAELAGYFIKLLTACVALCALGTLIWVFFVIVSLLA